MKNQLMSAKQLFEKSIIERAQNENPFEKIGIIVYQTLENAILTLQIEPGSRLNVTKIADDMGISVSPVRDALEQLVANGLVTVEQKSDSKYNSYHVFDLSNSAIQNLFTARKAIESMAAFICAQHNWSVSLEKLEDLALAFQKTLRENIGNDLDEQRAAKTAKLDRGFHTLIVNSADNKYLSDMYDTLGRILIYLSIRTCKFFCAEQDPDNILLMGAQHVAIYNAIKNGYPEMAKDIMDTHIDICCHGSIWNRNLMTRFK